MRCLHRHFVVRPHLVHLRRRALAHAAESSVHPAVALAMLALAAVSVFG